MATILLVDDDVDVTEANRAVLAYRGHTVKVAHSAGQARDILASSAVDAAVIDVMMESVSAGFDLAREVHRSRPDLPMLVLSGIARAHDLPFTFTPDGDWLPVVKFLDKPVPPDRLADEVESALAGSREKGARPAVGPGDSACRQGGDPATRQ